jgi:hypothetical protein
MAMNQAYFWCGVAALSVVIRLHQLLRPVPWGTAKVLVWLFALLFMAGLVRNAGRTAGRLGVAPVEESRRAVFGMALATLIGISLALFVPDLVKRLGR